MSLMEWLSHHHVDIACFQETHAVSSAESSSWFSPFGFLAVSGLGTAHARAHARGLYRPLVAHLVVHQAVTREVVSSRLRPDQHSGS